MHTQAVREQPILPLLSTMSDQPLSIRYILEHAVRSHGRKRVISRDGAGVVRFTYEEFSARVARLAHALIRLGVRPGDRVASAQHRDLFGGA